MTTTNDLAELSPLGKSSAYRTDYAPELLFPIPRQGKRDELELHGTLPFFGLDIWNAYELSWLNQRGKPQVAIAKISAPADSPNIIESKSFKLYLNSYNQTKLDSPEALLTLLKQDLSNGFGAPVQVELTLQEDFGKLKMGEFDGVLLDRLDLEITQYSPSPQLLEGGAGRSTGGRKTRLAPAQIELPGDGPARLGQRADRVCRAADRPGKPAALSDWFPRTQ